MTDTADGVFTELEVLEIGYAAEDHAARYYGGPMRFGVTDAARYVAEGHLHHLIELHGFSRIWDMVAVYLTAHPEVLELSEQQRADRAADRRATAAELRRDAKRSFNRTEYDRADELITAAQRLEPRFGGYASIQERIAAARTSDGA